MDKKQRRLKSKFMEVFMSTKVHQTVFVLLFFIFISSLSAAGIQGVVNDQMGMIVSGAEVSAFGYSVNGDSLFYHTTSGTDGSFTLENMLSGKYKLICSHPMYVFYESEFFMLDESVALFMSVTLMPYHSDYSNSVAGHVYSSPPLLPAFIPLGGANVFLTNSDLMLTAYHTKSGNDGLYEFRNIIPGTYYLSAEAFGHIPQYSIDTIKVVNGADIAGADIYLVPMDPSEMVALSGHVWAADVDMPVYPAYITISPAIIFFENGDSTGIVPPDPMPPSITVTNNPDGSYEFTKIPKGYYNVSCEAQGYETQYVWNLDLTQGDQVQDFYLKKAVEPFENLLSGKIINKENQTPVAWAQIYLTSIDSISMYYLAWSIENGMYEFRSILPGKYEIMATAYGYENSIKDTLEILENSQITGFDIYLEPLNNNDLVTLSGYVWEDNTWATVYPARIVLFTCKANGDSLFYWTKNNPDGSYKISNIIPGRYTAKCVAQGYHPQVIHDLNLMQPEEYQDFYLTPLMSPPKGWITGKVYFDETGSPVVPAYISFFSENAVHHGVYTDGNGEYKANLPQGKYYVSCEYNYLWDRANYFYQEFYDDAHTLADATPVEVLPEETTSDINFGIPSSLPVPTVTLTGRVTDDQNTPLEKALVRVWQIDVPVMAANSNSGTYTGYTDANGYYKIEFKLEQLFAPFPVNGFIVSAEKSGYQIEFFKEKSEPYLADILFAFSDTVFSNIDFTLELQPEGNSISGVITTEDGQPLSNVFIIGASISSGQIVFTFSDIFGRYKLNNLKEDYYYLLFAVPGYVPEFYDNVYVWEEAKPVLAKGMITGIDASLTPIYRHFSWGILTGVIKDENDKPLSGALVMVKNVDGEVLNYGITDNSGSYQINGVPDGLYQICISKVNYSTTTAWVEFNSNESDMLLMNFNLPLNPARIPDDEEPLSQIPVQIELLSNYPNPFNPETTIRFGLPAAQDVRVTVYDLLGKDVKELVHGTMPAGMHQVSWNGTDNNGHQVASGLYFYALEARDLRLVKKMILNR